MGIVNLFETEKKSMELVMLLGISHRKKIKVIANMTYDILRSKVKVKVGQAKK